MKSRRNLFDSDLFNYALLIFIGIWFFIPFLGEVHLFDWDEANFAEAAREMIETGNFMRVTINYEPFWEKPPLFFWLQSASMKIFGINEFAARFPNAIFGILTLILVYTIGKKLYDKKFGLLWAGAFVGSFLPHFFFKSGIIDPVFNLFIFLGYSFIAFGIQSQKSRSKFLLYAGAGVMTGLAILTKGPVAFLIIALAIGVFWLVNHRQKIISFKDILVYGSAMCLTAGFFYGTETLLHGTWFIEEFIRYQIRLFRTGDAGHGRPFYFHFVIILFGCFPASFFAIRSFFKRTEEKPMQKLYNKLMVILFLVVLILFSIVKTKTVLYSSLTYFPVTFLAALHLHGLINGTLSWKKHLGTALIIFSVLIGVTITAFPILLYSKEWLLPLINDKFAVANLQRPVQWTGYEFLLGVFFLLAMLGSFILINRRKFKAGIIFFFASSALCLQIFMYIFTPKIEEYTQGGPIKFFKEKAKKDVYARTLFKSYADMFYSRIRISDRPESRDKEWLLTGPIDKPAYFVARMYQRKGLEKKYPDLEEIKEEYGFIYYVRRPQPSEEK
ncbi:MAG: ArnT family glycosyltransferase [Chitinispirillaceae bacterium]